MPNVIDGHELDSKLVPKEDRIMTSLSTVQVIAELREERDWYRDWWYRGKDIAISSLTSMGYTDAKAKRIAKRMYDEICTDKKKTRV